MTGATGFVGQALLDAAGDARIPVRALTRRPQGGRMGVEWVQGDLDDRQALARLVRGAEAVVHVAGVTSTPDPDQFEAGNVRGTLNVIAAAKAAGAQRFIFVSSLAAREPGLSVYGASKARAEKLVKASALDWTIVRPPTVYGPRDRDMFELFRAARWGVVPMPAEGRSSIIHAYDLARLLVALVPAAEETTQQVYEPDDGRAGGWSHYELARAIGWAMGRRPFVLKLSRQTMERAAKIDRFLRRDKARLTLDRASYMSHPDWVGDPSRAVPTDVWRPRIETREGLNATAKWYREEGWL